MMRFYPWEDVFFLTLMEKGSKEVDLSGDLQNPTETFLRRDDAYTDEVGRVNVSLTGVVGGPDFIGKCDRLDPTPLGGLLSHPADHIVHKYSIYVLSSKILLYFV